MKLSDRLETLECKRDDKARRVSNVAPNTVANITAETLEQGVTLEALDALNVPAFRYGTQITIHGKLPAFNPNARPGGYKAIFQNGNGSIGVRYSAIDAEKKKLIARASRVTEGGWRASANSSAFEVSRSFYVKDETQREAVKAECLAALRSLPVSLFYGSAFAFVLPYGMGYGCGAEIGAIPAADLWTLIDSLFGIKSEADLIKREQLAEQAQAAKRAEWEKEHEAHKAERAAKVETIRASLGAPLTVHPKAGESFRLVDSFSGEIKTFELTGTGKRTFYRLTHVNGQPQTYTKRKVMGNGWPKALEAGRLFPA